MTLFLHMGACLHGSSIISGLVSLFPITCQDPVNTYLLRLCRDLRDPKTGSPACDLVTVSRGETLIICLHNIHLFSRYEGERT